VLATLIVHALHSRPRHSVSRSSQSLLDRSWRVSLGICALTSVIAFAPLYSQATPAIELVSLGVGRSLPLDLASAVTQVTIANPEIADVVVLTEKSVVINAKQPGETDVLLAGDAMGRRHLRVTVFSASERRQIALGVKFAEVRRESLRELGLSTRATNTTGNGTQIAGTGGLAPDGPGAPPVAGGLGGRFLSGLATWTTRDLAVYLSTQERLGNARSLAEPTLLAGNRDSASFLAGGEIPVPIPQAGAGGQAFITIQYRPYGIKLVFRAEVLSDSLIKLAVEPEVSTLDYGNALLLSGFRIPALRTRRVGTTIDVRPGESLILSGLFNEEREQVRDGIPGLMSLPVIGALFSSTRWQKNQTELLIVVSPEIFDPHRPRDRDTIRLLPDPTTPPATEALQPRLPITPPGGPVRPTPPPAR
jgi:pilus assembly protein CpaC